MAGKKGKGPKSPWTAKARAEALKVYLDTGSSILTSEQTGIPSRTIRYWAMNDPEWVAISCQITRELRDLIRCEAGAAVKRAFKLLHTTNDPATMNAANKTIHTMAQTASLLEGEPTERGEHRFEYQPGQIREVASRVFGFDFDGDHRPVPALPD